MSIQDSDNLIIGRGGSVFKTTYLDLKQKLIDDGIGDGGGGGGGGTAVDFPPSQLPGASLTLQPAELTSDNGLLEFSTDGTNWVDSITTQSADVVQVRWKEGAHDTTPHGEDTTSTLNYKIIGGPLYTQVYEYTVNKVPDPFSFSDLTNTNLNDFVETAETIALTGYNAPLRAWATSDTSVPPELEIAVVVRSAITKAVGVWVPLPTSPDNSVLIDVNSSIRLRHKTTQETVSPNSTTLKVGWDEANSVSAVFNTTTANAIYDDPTLVPGDGEAIDRFGAAFEMSAPSGQSINHVSTDWQFASDAGFSSIIEESIEDSSNLLTYTMQTTLNEAQVIYARARFVDAAGVKSNYAVSNNLVAQPFFFWRYQIHITGGNGANSGDNKQTGGPGGEGYVVIESTIAGSSAPSGQIEWYNGERGGGYKDKEATGVGAFGEGNGYPWPGGGAYSGYGGGSSAVKLNGTLLAGVGGGGGAAWGYSNGAFGGIGASLPSSNGGNGTSPLGGSATNGQGGTSNQTPSDGGPGQSGGSGAGGGGGGYGGGGGATFDGGADRGGGSGGGGGSWNQPINYVNGNYKMTHAQATNVTGSANRVSVYKAPTTDPTNWTLVTQNDNQGIINLG